jgi:acetyl esterase/lipase
MKYGKHGLINFLLGAALVLSSCATMPGTISAIGTPGMDTYTKPVSAKAIARAAPSLQYGILEDGVWATGSKKGWERSEAELKAHFQNLDQSKRRLPPERLKKEFLITRHDINGRDNYLVEPKPGKKDAERTDRAVFYIHGGGFLFEMDFYDWNAVETLVSKLHIPVYICNYPLWPNLDADAIFSYIDTACRHLRSLFPQAEVSFIGSSSGTDFSISYCHWLIDHDRGPLPDKLILCSPAQLVGNGAETLKQMKDIDKKDPALSFKMVDSLASLFGFKALGPNYYTSPLYGDFRKFPPMYVFAGQHEIFYPEIPLFAQRVINQGGKIVFYSGKSMMHCWPLMPLATESKDAFKIIMKIIEG